MLGNGIEVAAAVRDPAKFVRRFPSATAIRADFNVLTHIDDWAPHLHNIDAVINCAGVLQTRFGNSASAVHAEAPIALFNAAQGFGIRKIIQISAVSVGAPTEYAQSKLAADEALQKLDVDWVILRPSIVFGSVAFGGTAMLRALAACPFAVPVVGNGGQLATPIHVDDLCATVRLALETPRLDRKVVSPCGPETLTLRDVCLKYRHWLGCRGDVVIEMPVSLVRATARLGDWFGKGPITTTSIRQLEFGNEADPAAFTSASGITPRSMDKALQQTPAGTADLWHARLYLIRPIIRIALILLWAASGLVGLLADETAIGQVLGGPDSSLSLAAGRAASLFDLVIAAMLLLRRWPRLVFALQVMAIAGYTGILTLLSPLWGDLLGPLLKNLPILALVCVQRILDEER